MVISFSGVPADKQNQPTQWHKFAPRNVSSLTSRCLIIAERTWAVSAALSSLARTTSSSNLGLFNEAEATTRADWPTWSLVDWSWGWVSVDKDYDHSLFMFKNDTTCNNIAGMFPAGFALLGAVAPVDSVAKSWPGPSKGRANIHYVWNLGYQTFRSASDMFLYCSCLFWMNNTYISSRF